MPDNYCDFNDCSTNLDWAHLTSPHSIALVLLISAIVFVWNAQSKKGHAWRIGRIVGWITIIPCSVLLARFIVDLWLTLVQMVAGVAGPMLIWYLIEPALGRWFHWSKDEYTFRQR